MALDDVLLECRANSLVPNTVHFLQFDPPAVLVGYHQVVEHEVRLEFCEERGIDVNRRITGGGAIFFDKSSLGWEIVASKFDLDFHQSIEELYRSLCKGAILGLEKLGIEAAFRPKNDIEIDGKKISGTGGTEKDDAFLFQGTLLIDFDVETMLRALRIPTIKLKDKEVKTLKERVTCVSWQLGHKCSVGRVKEALKEGFQEALGTEFSDSELTVHEEGFLKDRVNKFQSAKWVFLQRRPLNEAVEVHAINKTSGGLIRASLAIDERTQIIKSAIITGDFFAYPSRAILDLEASLKNVPSDESEVRNVVHHFFEVSGAKIPGVTPEEFTKVIIEATRKMSYRFFGVSTPEANHIYPILKDTEETLSNGCNILLLPYCAKLLKCEYRKKDGCIKCGKCSVGTAYTMAEEAGFIPITIQNFEHLIETLRELRQNNHGGYIGCCCEAFLCKHQQDLEDAGVPGIIVDIDNETCYDLGKEEEALQGNFERQTELKINLLRKLMDIAGNRQQAGRPAK